MEDREYRKLAAAVLAVAKSEGFIYSGDDILSELGNPRVLKWATTAKAVISAYRKAK